MKKLKKQAIGLGVGAVGLSVGSSVLGDIGGTTAAKGQAGLYNVAKFMPATGTLIGGGFLLRSMDLLKRKVRRRK